MAIPQPISVNGDGGRIQFLQTLYNAQVVEGLEVPAGEAWLIRTASISSNDSTATELAIEIRSRVITQGNAYGWFNGLQVFPVHGATPKAAITRMVILEAGERLAARSPTPLTDLYLLYTGWRYPASAVPTLLCGNIA